MSPHESFESVKRFALTVIWLFVVSGTSQAEEFTSKCVGVTDGDTISVMRDGSEVKIRLEGIDAPESGQDFSQRSKQFTASLVFGKEVTVKVKESDRYGRLVSRVLVAGTDVSIALVKAGLAWHFKKYSTDQELSDLEVQARLGKVGLWSMASPMAPWDYRHRPIPQTEGPGTIFHGNVRSMIYHRPTCKVYHCENCTAKFNTSAEAKGAGYRACRCRS